MRYDILEYGHSTAILLNEYLRTGDDSLLRFTYPAANFGFIKNVKKFNDSVPDQRKISFYGIDFEGRQDDKHLKKAIDIILQNTRLPDTANLHGLLNKIKNSNKKAAPSYLQDLKSYLGQHESICRDKLGRYYIDLALVANAQYNFSPRRDDAMYANFNLLYQELTKTGDNPLFLSSFGYAHINPGNEQSISYRLQNSANSPVRNKVSLIGIQYYQSSFQQEGKKKWVGNLSFLCKEKSLQDMGKLGGDGKPAMYYLSPARLSLLACDPVIKRMSAVILVTNVK